MRLMTFYGWNVQSGKFGVFYFLKFLLSYANLLMQKCLLLQMKPGCSSELSGVKTTDAQLIQIKVTSAGLWSQNESESTLVDVPESETKMDEAQMETLDDEGLTFSAAKFWLNWISGTSRGRMALKFWGRMALKFWKSDTDILEHQAESLTYSESVKATVDEAITKTDKEETRNSFPLSAKETLKAAVIHFGNKWHRRLSFVWRHAVHIIGNFQKLWNITGIHLDLDVPKWLHILHLDRLNLYAVQWLENKSNAFEPTYLYTMEKGYFLLPEAAKSQHNIRTINISISARHSCFGNRWQQLLINRVVGYDTILMNSLQNSPGQGYLYNYQTREFYNLSYTYEPAQGPARFGDYLVTKCGVLMMSLFVFLTTTMSVSFTLRETQTRMLKFTVQLQHHARHRLPTFQLIFVHVIESLVFVPIMIGILFFMFEFYDDQLLAFMVLILVWLCELFTLISVRTPISMKFFPRFFLLYFLVFHIYFFSYAYVFSYLALATTAAFMQHLILYFWNRFEVPTLQRFMQNRRSQLQQHPDYRITSSTILASTLHITRLNTRNPGQVNADLAPLPAALRSESDQATPANGAEAPEVPRRSENGNIEGNPVQIPAQPDLQQAETGPSPGTMNSFSSLLLWILGGASSEGLNSFLSMFRDVRDQGQVYPESPVNENRATGNVQ
ncbi:membralin-like protein At1g60995 isoform X3 [Tripterygium wilfordii]|uniref:membralin-like protein At1g60995 isoform X3 n=1 Tax=Tripterygium wilfordii TaxID=458696 RepID=UPI0018F830AA|nr:membralin-like protein At1g60995 isoform X3 [Tripterygium wilfordii]